jgi:ribonucleoside-diphosphate reductase alpha chain
MESGTPVGIGAGKARTIATEEPAPRRVEMNEEVVSGAPAEGSDEEAMREQGINLADKGAALKNETSVETSDGVTNERRTPRAVRRHLPDERCGITHKFSVGGQEGYVTVGLFEDGLPGEIFIRISKEGSTVSGLMDSFATAVSLALQYGVPLRVLCAKFSHMRFEPSGWSGNPEIGYAKSLTDYLFRWLELRFLKGEQRTLFENLPIRAAPTAVPRANGNGGSTARALADVVDLGDAPTCQFCGSLMVRNGSCYRCLECGSTSGCS